MRNLAFLILIISLATISFGQDTNPAPPSDSQEKTAEQQAIDEEREVFRKAIAEKEASRRISALKRFISKYPESKQKNRALGLIVSGRAELADKSLRSGDKKKSVELFKLAVKEAPEPVSDRLFRAIILQIPNNLFFQGERVGGVEVAKLIEDKVSDNPNQLLALTTFYIGVENAPAAIRVAEKVIELNPETKGVYQVLGLANRFNFNLDKSAEAYAKALAANQDSIATKISLAEMYRATGKTEEALKLYQEVLEKEPKNLSALTGQTLTLFDLDRVDDAEYRMQLALIEEPKNLFLLVGAAYWYAAKGNGEKAVELSQVALTIEPRYTWGYIALARGYMKMGDPVAAERVLFTAKNFGNFPTLQYETATAQLAAGFYKDAAKEISKSFVLVDGKLKTNLGGRFEVEGDNFNDLLALERQASIFQPLSAYEKINDLGLKKLLAFSSKLQSEEVEETDVIESAKEFIDGEDKMKTHRQMFVANQFLEKEMALPTVLEIAKEAVKGVELALTAPNPSSAILADELYEARRLANAKGEILNTPQIDQNTLESILRGRIEQISGWALHKQNDNDQAEIRFKRAISVYPKDSVWLRTTNWRMGVILNDQDRKKEALDYFIKGYSPEENSELKKVILESVYKDIYGSLEGFEERLKNKPTETNSSNLFVKKDESNEQKTNLNEEQNLEPKKENTEEKTKPTQEVSSNNLENTDTPKIDEKDATKTVETTEKPNVQKLPEDIDLNVFDPTKPKTKPQTKVVEKKDTTENEVKENIKKDTKVTETKSNVNNSETTKNDDTKTNSKVETTEGSDKEKTTIIGKPIVVIQDNLTNTEKKVETKVEEKKEKETKAESKNDDDEKTDDGDSTVARPRFVNVKDSNSTQIAEPTCKILVDKESVTIFNKGEVIDIVVGAEKIVEGSPITATASNPEDIEVVFEPEFAGEKGSAFFLIRSITAKTGDYKIIFDTPCGKKEVPVKVR